MRWEFAKGNSPRSRVPIAFESTRVGSTRELLNEAISKMLEKGMIEPVEDGQSPGFYSHLFVVPKISGVEALQDGDSCLDNGDDVAK